jgi:hypothetical protein
MLEVSNRPFATYCAAALTWSLTEQSGRSLVASCQHVYGVHGLVQRFRLALADVKRLFDLQGTEGFSAPASVPARPRRRS